MHGINPIAAVILGILAATATWFAWGVASHLYYDHVQIDLWRAAAIQQQQAQQPQAPR